VTILAALYQKPVPRHARLQELLGVIVQVGMLFDVK